MVYTALNKGNTHFARCILNTGNAAIVDMLIDTGAAATVVRKNAIAKSRIVFTGKRKSFISVYRQKIQMAQILVSQFTVGSIDLGEQLVWCDEDNVSSTSLLGVDILHQLSWEYSANTGCLSFAKGTPIAPNVPVVLSEFCAEHNLAIDKLINCFPDNWESLSTETLRNLAEFTYNNLK